MIVYINTTSILHYLNTFSFKCRDYNNLSFKLVIICLLTLLKIDCNYVIMHLYTGHLCYELHLILCIIFYFINPMLILLIAIIILY